MPPHSALLHRTKCPGFISANSGIGYLAMNAREFLQTDVVVVAIILYALLGKLADVSAQLLERLWLRWNPAYHLKEATV